MIISKNYYFGETFLLVMTNHAHVILEIVFKDIIIIVVKYVNVIIAVLMTYLLVVVKIVFVLILSIIGNHYQKIQEK